MNHPLALTFCTAAALLASAAQAAPTVDTGSPNGVATFAYAFDANDSYAGQVTFSEAVEIQSIATHVLQGARGETFTIVLYGDGPAFAPTYARYSTTATFVADGWNGVAGLSGWQVGAGRYWVGFEIGSADTLGTGTGGALLDRGVPQPLTRTAFNPGSGYQATSAALDFGLRVETVSAVPEPGSVALMLAGIALIVPVARRHPRR